MKIGLIGPKDSKDSLLLKTEFEARGHICKRLVLQDIFFSIEGNTFMAKHRRFDLKDFDIFVFRSIKSSLQEGFMLAKYLHQIGKIVIDEGLFESTFSTFISEKAQLASAGLPQVEQVMTFSRKSARDVLMDLNHPILITPIQEGRGSTQISEDWTDSYDFTRTHKITSFIFTKYLDIQKIYRLYTLGGAIVGGMERTITDQDAKMHYSKSFKSKAYTPSEEHKELALKTIQCLKLEIAAVDIIQFEGKNMLLQVLRAPRFRKFEEITKIPYKTLLVEYIENKIIK